MNNIFLIITDSGEARELKLKLELKLGLERELETRAARTCRVNECPPS